MSFKELPGTAAAVAAKAFTSFPPARWLLSKLQRVRAREVAEKTYTRMHFHILRERGNGFQS